MPPVLSWGVSPRHGKDDHPWSRGMQLNFGNLGETVDAGFGVWAFKDLPKMSLFRHLYWAIGGTILGRCTPRFPTERSFESAGWRLRRSKHFQ